jgi:copper(I)-binding protein
MRKGLVLALVCAALAACSPPAAKTEAASAPAATAPEAAPVFPVISDGWAAVTPNGAKVAAGYMTITNPGSEPDTLVSVSSQRSPKVEVHEMKMDGAMMTMAPVKGGLAIPAGGSVTLEPGGLHVMFVGIDAGFIEGEIVPLTLTFAKAGAVPATLTVRKPDSAAPAHH